MIPYGRSCPGSVRVPLILSGGEEVGGLTALGGDIRAPSVYSPLGHLLCFLSADQGEASTKNQQSTNADQPGDLRVLGTDSFWGHVQNEVDGVGGFPMSGACRGPRRTLNHGDHFGKLDGKKKKIRCLCVHFLLAREMQRVRNGTRVISRSMFHDIVTYFEFLERDEDVCASRAATSNWREMCKMH